MTLVDASQSVNGLPAGIASGEITVPGDTFVPDAPGCQVVEPHGCVEIPVTGSPRVVLKATHRARWQVRRLA